MSDDEELRERIAADMPRTVAELERLVRIPSMGYPGYDPADVRASAETTRDILREAGVEDARLLELDGGHPAVFGEITRTRRRADGPALRAPRRAARGSGRPVGHATVRTGREGRTDVRAWCRGRQERHRRARRRDPCPAGRRRTSGDDQGRRRRRRGVLDRASARPRPRPRRPAESGRRRDRRRRQLPHRCPDDEHLDPRRDRHRGAGPGPPECPALGRVRRTDPGCDHRARAHDLLAPHRRGRRRDRRSEAIRVGGRPDPRRRVPRRVGRARLREVDRGRARSRTVYCPPPRSPCWASTRRRSPARRTRSCRSLALA